MYNWSIKVIKRMVGRSRHWPHGHVNTSHVNLPWNKLWINSIVKHFHTKATTYHLSLNFHLKTVKPCFSFVKYAFFSFEHHFPYTFTWKFERWHLPEQFCVARGVTRADAYTRTQNNKEKRASSISVYT